MRIDKLAPVKTAAVERHNEHLCGCNIGCDGNVVYVAKAKQTHLCLGRSFRGVGRTEIEDEVDLIIGDL